MPNLDDLLRDRLTRTVRRGDPQTLYESLSSRRRRREVRRKISAVALVIVVVAASVGLVLTLSHAFRTSVRPGDGEVRNGAIYFWSGGQAPPTAPVGIYRLGSVGPTEIVDSAETPFALSADGTLLAYVRTISQPSAADPTGTLRMSIVVASADGSGPRQVLAVEGGVDDLAFSPSGDRIGFVHELLSSGSFSDADRKTDLWTVALDGSYPQQITTDGRVDAFSWSPNGSRFVVERSPVAGSGTSSLYIVEGQGASQTERLLVEDGRDPAWDPTGASIAYLGRASNDPADYELYEIAAAGGQAIRLTDTSASVDDVAWSPDGRFLLVSELGSTDQYGTLTCRLVRVMRDGSESTVVYQPPPSEQVGSSSQPCPVYVAWQPLPAQ